MQVEGEKILESIFSSIDVQINCDDVCTLRLLNQNLFCCLGNSQELICKIFHFADFVNYMFHIRLIWMTIKRKQNFSHRGICIFYCLFFIVVQFQVSLFPAITLPCPTCPLIPYSILPSLLTLSMGPLYMCICNDKWAAYCHGLSTKCLVIAILPSQQTCMIP